MNGVAKRVVKKAKSKAKNRIRDAAKQAGAPVLKTAKRAVDSAADQVEQGLEFGLGKALGRVASLPVEVARETADSLLVEKYSRKKRGGPGRDTREFQRTHPLAPEFVDHLPVVQTASQHVIEKNPGPPKRGGKPKRLTKRKARKIDRALERRADMLHKLKVRYPGQGPKRKIIRRAKIRNKKTGKQTGYTMTSRDYLGIVTIASNASAGQSVIQTWANPHYLGLPDLDLEAKRWEMFDCDMTIHMIPSGNTYIDGRLLGWFDADVEDLPVTSSPTVLVQHAMLHGAKPLSYPRGGTWRPAPSQRTKATKWFFCDQTGSTIADDRQCNKWLFNCIVERPPVIYTGVSATGVALNVEFYVTYKFRFRNRTLDTATSQTTLGGQSLAFTTVTGGSATDPLNFSSATAPALLSSYSRNFDGLLLDAGTNVSYIMKVSRTQVITTPDLLGFQISTPTAGTLTTFALTSNATTVDSVFTTASNAVTGTYVGTIPGTGSSSAYVTVSPYARLWDGNHWTYTGSGATFYYHWYLSFTAATAASNGFDCMVWHIPPASTLSHFDRMCGLATLEGRARVEFEKQGKECDFAVFKDKYMSEATKETKSLEYLERKCADLEIEKRLAEQESKMLRGVQGRGAPLRISLEDDEDMEDLFETESVKLRRRAPLELKDIKVERKAGSLK
jgi:hypothetical protein